MSVTFSNLNRFLIILQSGKRMKFATKPRWHYPSHLRHVATRPWEIKTSNSLQILKKKQTNCIFNRLYLCYSSTNCDIFGVKIWNLSPYWLQIKFSMSLFFTYLLWWSICGIANSSPQTSLQCLSTINMILSDEDKILLKSVSEVVHSKDRRISQVKMDKAWR